MGTPGGVSSPGGPAIEIGDEHEALRAATDRRHGREFAGLTVGGVAVATGLAVSGAFTSLGDLGSPTVWAAATGVSLVAAGTAGLTARRSHRTLHATRRPPVRIALHDPLTDLPNRNLLETWVAAEIAASQQKGTQAAVVFIDLNRFKHVNDAYGHHTGDLLMQSVADRLRSLRRPGDRVLRSGGDEFVLVCTGSKGSASIERLTRRIVHLLEQPFTVEDQVIRISACVGAALAEHHGIHAADLIRDAEMAKHRAGAQGPGQTVVFDRGRHGESTPVSAARQMREALDNREFHLHYQPVVDLATGRIVGAEALLRWMSPHRGTVAPDEFVPILEETGLIVPVGTWVLREACAQAARLTRLLGTERPFSLTINVSARQLAQDGFAELVADTIAQAGIQDGQVHLEITEGALMHDVDSAWAVLRQAKALGVKLALDDFGTGYSSLSYVRRFSLDMLKIDKSFIDGVDSSAEDRAIVEHVIGMAKALGMVTVAEGAERPEQLAWLRQIGCRLAQGFALSRPLSAPDLEALLVRRLDQPFQFGTVNDAGVPILPPLGAVDLAELESMLSESVLDAASDHDERSAPPLVFDPGDRAPIELAPDRPAADADVDADLSRPTRSYRPPFDPDRLSLEHERRGPGGHQPEPALAGPGAPTGAKPLPRFRRYDPAHPDDPTVIA